MLSQSTSIQIKILCPKTQQHTLTQNSKSLSGMHTSISLTKARSLTEASTDLTWVIGQSHNIQLLKIHLDHIVPSFLLETQILFVKGCLNCHHYPPSSIPNPQTYVFQALLMRCKVHNTSCQLCNGIMWISMQNL